MCHTLCQELILEILWKYGSYKSHGRMVPAISWQNGSCKSYDRLILTNLMAEWFLQILWQNGSCKSYDRMVPANLVAEWFLQILWQLITPETELVRIIS